VTKTASDRSPVANNQHFPSKIKEPAKQIAQPLDPIPPTLPGSLPGAENLLLNSVREMAQNAGWKTLQLRYLKPPDHYQQADKSNVTQIVQLPHDPEVFWKNLDRKLRWTINKSRQGPLKKVMGEDHVRGGLFEDLHNLVRQPLSQSLVLSDGLSYGSR
jgi:hypothetical protein